MASRSTVRIDEDVMRELRERASKTKTSLTQTLNATLRAGLSAEKAVRRRRRHFRQQTFSMGPPQIDLTKALALAAAMEDEEIARKWALRK